MLRYFYRLMVMACGFFLASSCGHSTPMYGIEETDYDDGTFDEEVVEEPDGDDHGITPTESDVMYGCPAADFNVEGTILTVDGTPVPGISITPDPAWASSHQVYDGEAESDTSGEFVLAASTVCGGSAYSITLSVKDVDGAANGEFVDQQVVVPLSCTDVGSWEDACSNSGPVLISMQKKEVSDDDALPSDEDGAVDEDAVDSLFDDDGMPDEDVDHTIYGCIGCEFDVQGTVADAQGSPLKDIEVVVEQLDNPYAKTTAKTNAEGVFTVALNSNYGCNINEDSAVTVTFNDIDGAANGGSFASKEANLNLPWKGYDSEPCTYEKNDIEVKLDKVGDDDDSLLPDE